MVRSRAEITYTLTFSEPVQSVTAGDLEVDGGVITDVDHTPGEMTGATAKVTVTVDDDSTDPVEIKVTSDILDVAGNPLITKTDSTQQVDTQNPTVDIESSHAESVAYDDDDSVTYTLTFGEPVQSVTADDLDVDGGEITEVVHTPNTNTATVKVTVDDGSTANVKITAKDSIVDIAGNR